jgi:CRP/FNR family transcriptional regulator, cyclic AMP receptor protein
MPAVVRPARPKELEDALSYLPRKGVVQYRRGEIIYDEDQPASEIYLVVQGRVKVTVPSAQGQSVLGIFSTDQFFGERGLLELQRRGDRATALENASVMCWSTQEIEENVEREPRLGLALAQTLVDRCIDLEERMEGLALYKTPQRVAWSLLRFAERLGVRDDDGSLRMPPLTHQLISEYIGTSREIVTFQMNQLRRQGFVRYSRREVFVYKEALEERLRQPW